MLGEIDGPAYIISDTNGWRITATYYDGWCYGPSACLYDERGGSHEAAREKIKRHIRQNPSERNSLPLYHVSDHGNVERRRAIRLRKV